MYFAGILGHHHHQNGHHQPSLLHHAPHQQQEQQKYLTEQIADSERQTKDVNKNDKAVSHRLREDSRIPLSIGHIVLQVPSTVKNVTTVNSRSGVGGGGGGVKSSAVSYIGNVLVNENVIEANDNNVEGGGDKEFHTEDLLSIASNKQIIPETAGTSTVAAATAIKTRHRRTVDSPDRHSQKQQHEEPKISDSKRQALPPPLIPPPHPPPTIKQRSAYNSNAAVNSTPVQHRASKLKSNIQQSSSAAIPYNDMLFGHSSSDNSSTITITTTLTTTVKPTATLTPITSANNRNSKNLTKSETSELNVIENQNSNLNEQIIIISNGDGRNDGATAAARSRASNSMRHNTDSRNSITDSSNNNNNNNDMYDGMMSDEPKVLPLRPIIRGPYDDDHQGEMTVVYAEPHTEIKLNCDVDLDIMSTVWMKDGQVSFHLYIKGICFEGYMCMCVSNLPL